MTRKLGAIFLMAGTTIGGAMIALPVSTAELGFSGAIIQFFVCWVFMTISALYFVEALADKPAGTNLFTLATDAFPKFGSILTFGSYMILLYALTAVYSSGMADWINEISVYFGYSQSFVRSALIFNALAFIILITGIRGVDSLNRLLFTTLIICFCVFTTKAWDNINFNLLDDHFAMSLRPIPLLVTGFGFHIIIPTIFGYLHNDVRRTKHVILIGSVLPIIIYCIWQMTIMGLIPLGGDNGLIAIGQRGHPAFELTSTLPALLSDKDVRTILRLFAFCALATSFLGVSLSLIDCLKDSKLKSLPRPMLAIFTLGPPLGFILYYPTAFLFALHFAGLFVAFLLGVFPAALVIKRRLAGGKPIAGPSWLAYITGLFFTLVVFIEIANLW